jgi:NAD(P)-dependent dehydrogenase (short-subunit alcohol dehydrogenase family)
MTARTVQQLFDLTGKTALITGGSRGLGLQMAHALGEAGARDHAQLAQGRRPGGGRGRLQAAGIDARWIAADCAKEEDIRKLADQTCERMGDVDILVNNAGAAWGAPAEDHPVEAWDKVMNLNVRGYFILSQQVAKRSMIPRKTGRIINIASVAGLGGNPPEMKTLAYNTSKGAVITFTAGAGLRMGQVRHQRQRHLPGLLPEQDDQGHAGVARRRQAGRERAAAPPGRRRGPEGHDAAVRVRCRQAHHRPVAGGGRRRQRGARGLSTGNPKLFVSLRHPPRRGRHRRPGKAGCAVSHEKIQ